MTELSKTEIDIKIVSILRNNPSQWYSNGNLVIRIFENVTGNERHIARMRMHRHLNTMVRIDIVERREMEYYEYKWKIK